nr:hypothetical protein B0A51_05567 [Rachicladosporium sp. CCFEE 5018]
MPFSHHSHSGEFCGHAVNTLEEVVLHAIKIGMTTFCMTEHMPRSRQDFYPEEESKHDEASLAKLFDSYYTEARRLQKAYADQIQLFVGFESEWIRDSSVDQIHALRSNYDVELFVGSVHHVHGIPIDYDTPYYHKARDVAGGKDDQLFADYFDLQYQMLQQLKPPVVGHFDLIRLKSDDPERCFKTWPGVWSKIERNLKFIAGYGGIVELNSSALRKGMSEPYPQLEICQTFLKMGGRFTFSDDSHGIDQIGANYKRVLDAIRKAQIESVVYLVPQGFAGASEAVSGMVSHKLILSAIAALATSAVHSSPVAPISPILSIPAVPLSPGAAAKDGHVAPPTYAQAEMWMDEHKMNSMVTYCDSDYRSKRMKTRFEIWGYLDRLNLNFFEGLAAAATNCRHPEEIQWAVEPTNNEYAPFYVKWYQNPSSDDCTSQAITDFVGTWPGVKCT